MAAQVRPGTPFDIPPRWTIISAAGAPPLPCVDFPGRVPILIPPGPSFGDGRHETTQLCLQAISALAPRSLPFRVLDFGSGSGILAIAAAKLGGQVMAVEIDETGLAATRLNAALNGVRNQVEGALTLEGAPGPFDLVLANILRPVIVAFAEALVTRLAPKARLVLSGLVSTDVPEVTARYAPLLQGLRPEVFERGPWRALVWSR